MMCEYDMAVVGCGPAGATFARLISKKYKVVVIDKKSAGTKFEKPCGGLLSEDAQKALSQFEITLPKEVLVSPQIFAVRTIDVGAKIIKHYQRTYLNMDRHKFDLWMMSMIPDSVDKVSGECRNISRSGEGFKIEIKDSDQNERAISAKYIIGADGANSIVRKKFFRSKKPREYVAIQQWFKGEDINPFYSCIFDRETSDCCSWSISKNGYFIFGGAFPKKDCREAFERQKKRLENFGFFFKDPLKTEACIVLRPRGLFDFACAEDGAFLIGEAAGFISPSSLEGISWAINSGAILADVFNKNKAKFEQKYKRKTIKLRLRLLGKVIKCPFMYKPGLRKIVMKSGLKTIEIRK